MFTPIQIDPHGAGVRLLARYAINGLLGLQVLLRDFGNETVVFNK
jgi:hypothetical protein